MYVKGWNHKAGTDLTTLYFPGHHGEILKQFRKKLVQGIPVILHLYQMGKRKETVFF